MDVPVAQWDSTVAWFITNYAGLYPLSFLVCTFCSLGRLWSKALTCIACRQVPNFVQTPVTSMVSLVNAEAATKNGWFLLSGDIQAHVVL
jgi:hypothetical protein